MQYGKGLRVKRLKLAFVGLATCAALLAPWRTADAVVIERVVAVVGDRPILLSELRHRARPNLLRLVAGGKDANFQAAAQTEIFKELLNKMIDDRLEEQVAEKSRLSVNNEEVDRGISNVANNAKTSVPGVLEEVRRQGLSEQDFREELKRQILEGKLIELRVRPRVRVTDQDAHVAYQHWKSELAEQQPIEIRVMALRVPAGASQQQVQSRFKLADEVARRARSGEDFCALIQQFTDDSETRETCGSRGPQPRKLLLPPIQEAIKSMKPNDISQPVRIQYGIDAIVVFQLMNEPKVPTYSDVKQEMGQKAILDALDRQRKLWLEELRRGVYIDVRL